MRSSKVLHPTCSSSQCSDSPRFQLQRLSNRGLVGGDSSNFGSGLSWPCLCCRISKSRDSGTGPLSLVLSELWGSPRADSPSVVCLFGYGLVSLCVGKRWRLNGARWCRPVGARLDFISRKRVELDDQFGSLLPNYRIELSSLYMRYSCSVVGLPRSSDGTVCFILSRPFTQRSDAWCHHAVDPVDST